VFASLVGKTAVARVSILYPVIGDPPSDAGVFQWRVMLVAFALSVRLVGASGIEAAETFCKKLLVDMMQIEKANAARKAEVTIVGRTFHGVRWAVIKFLFRS
jgi:hypothetical protein